MALSLSKQILQSPLVILTDLLHKKQEDKGGFCNLGVPFMGKFLLFLFAGILSHSSLIIASLLIGGPIIQF